MPKKRLALSEQSKEYQNAYAFALRFQASKLCLEFRVAWKIPPTGFKSYAEHQAWERQLFKKTNEWLAGEKYASFSKQRDQMRLKEAKGQVSRSDLLVFAWSIEQTVPLYKYQSDINDVLRREDLPAYWKGFVEKCLLFANPEIHPVVRPEPKARARWSNDLQGNVLEIENIFADTPVKDFRSKRFVRDYLILVQKLPGYWLTQTRAKKNFEKYQTALKLTKDERGSDYEFGEMLYGPTEDGKVENKNKEKAKKIRYHAKKLTRPKGN